MSDQNELRRPIPLDEPARSSALHRYDILDTPREAEFDDIAALAAEVCQTPIAVVNLVDTERQFFKAEVGLGVRETPLDTSFCGTAILSEDILVVPDALLDPRFACNPLVTQSGGLRFYAGALLKTSDGHAIGTVCVLDTRPRSLDDHQIRTLRMLARQAMTQLDLRKALVDSRQAEARHRQVLDSAVDYAIISLDLAGLVIGWSLGAQHVLGWSEVEMLGKSAATIFTPSDRAAGVPRQEMDAARETGRGTDERWHLKKDGTRFFALGEMMPLRDDADRHVGYVKILRDRTQQRRQTQRLALLAAASSALLTSEDPAAALRPILEGGADTIGFDNCFLYDLSADRKRLLLRHSVRADEEMLAGLRDVPLDVPLCGIVVESDRPLILSNLREDTQPRYEIARTMGFRAFAGFPIRVKGRLVGVTSFGSSEIESFDEEALSFFRTIARFLSLARERAEDARALRDAEQRSRLAQEAGGVGTFELDMETGSLLASPEFCRVFGVPEKVCYPAALFEGLVLDEDAIHRSDHQRRRDGSAPLDVEYRIRRADDGKERWVARRAEFIRDEKGIVRSMVGTVLDITEKKVAALRQEALLRLGNSVREAKGKKDVVQRACEIVLEALEAAQAGYVAFDRRGERFKLVGEQNAPGVSEDSATAILADLANSISKLVAGDPIVLRNATNEGTAEAPSDLGTVIAVPRLEGGALHGILYVRRAQKQLWTNAEIDFLRRAADRLYAALAVAQAEEEQSLLNHELSHRLKNSLAMVHAFASQTLRKAAEPAALKDFLGRLRALSNAHDVLLHRNWEAASIADTVRSTMAPLTEAHRFELRGPTIDLAARGTLALSMLLHELATNALKYGALSNDVGLVRIDWRVDRDASRDGELVVEWRESGGPAVSPPPRTGFGSRLITAGFSESGEVQMEFLPSGLVTTVRAPLSEVLAI